MMIKKQYLKLFFIFLSITFLSHANAVCKKDGGKLHTSGLNPGNPVENLGEGFLKFRIDTNNLEIYEVDILGKTLCV